MSLGGLRLLLQLVRRAACVGTPKNMVKHKKRTIFVDEIASEAAVDPLSVFSVIKGSS